MRTVSLSYENNKRIKATSAIGSLVIHLLAFLLFSLLVVWNPKVPDLIELDWGASSGAPNQSITQTEDNPNKQKESAETSGPAGKSNVDLPEMKNPSAESIPTAKKSTKATSLSSRRSKSTAEDTPVSKHRRARGGTAGGAGKSTGYSIEWSGTGSRKLLSGRLPKYPEGTDKEMPVLLEFTVLPDGSVSSVIPLRRSDELLERESISALRTWRFDPLPPQLEQKPQAGKITFIFKLEP